MRRHADIDNEPRRPSSRRSRRPGWILRLGLLSTVLATVSLLLAPWFLSSPALVNSAIKRLGGLEPLGVQVGGVTVGWFSPAAVSDIKLMDASGAVLASVQSISTEKGIIGWVTDPSNLGTVTIQGVDADVIISGGSTNLEEALAGLLHQEQTEDPVAKTSRTLSGSVMISDARLRLRDASSPQLWLVDVPKLSVAMPTENQLLGPIELKAIVSETTGSVSNSQGQILAKAEQVADGSIEVRAKLDNLSLDVWNVIHSRLPSIPVVQMAGHASGVLAGNAKDPESWTFDLQQVQIDGLEVSAPELIGPAPARLDRIAAGGRVSLFNQRLHLENTQVVSDVGNLSATASSPWPVTLPSPASPVIRDAAYSATGTLDLPQLVRAAESLLPMRQDVQLVSGRVQFQVAQEPQTGSDLATRMQLTFSDMQATSGNQPISWNEPLSIDLLAIQQPAGTRFELGTTAEFCDIRGSGNAETGQLTGNVNLDLLHRRLSQFMELPVSTMTGSANLNVQWQIDAQQAVVANGSLQTTPLIIATSSGNQMREPAWNGKFTANTQLENGSPQQLQRLHVELISADEQLIADLHEPILLSTDSALSPLPPAAFNVSVTGDLANWKRRGWVWLSQPPELEIEGQIQLALSGKLDAQHVEILQANWDSKPLSLRTADLGLAEPQMIGNFKGRIDSSDLTRLQVEQLTVQANSFWIVAQDQAAEQGAARSGQARWMLDVARFMQNLSAVAANRPLAGSAGSSNILTSGNSLPPNPTSNPPASEYAATGILQGDLNWLVAKTGASFALQARGENIAVHQNTPGAASPTMLWSEPSITTAVQGQWTSQDGTVELSSMQLQAPWIQYQGKLSYQTADTVQTLASDGQAVYDAGLLSQKLDAMIGRNFQMVGQQTAPISVRWRRDTQSSSPALSGLQASTQLGWRQARLIGIEVGEANVPVTVDGGLLASAAEIPVSGGKLRWDITSDLTQEALVIDQKPMTILENVAITPEMCSGWLKYVAPLVAETTSIDGRLSLVINEAKLTPADLNGQTVDGQLIMHRAAVGPGPLANEVTGLIRQLEAIRKADPAQAANAQNRAWLQLPEQQIAFRMQEGKVYHRDLRFTAGDATLTTSGYVDIAGKMEMNIALPIPEAWTQRGPVLAALRGQTLQFPLRGSITRPQLDASLLGQLGRQTIENAAQGLLQQGINRGLEKLFK